MPKTSKGNRKLKINKTHQFVSNIKIMVIKTDFQYLIMPRSAAITSFIRFGTQ